jgi:hypothetical protein
MIVISADPGTKNFAVTIAEHTIVNGKVRSKILVTGMIDTTITDLNQGVAASIKRFEKTMRDLRKQYKPELAYIERFQSRGLKGTTIECINIMLGIFVRVFIDLNPTLLLASTWKNRANKQFDLKAVYSGYDLDKKRSPKTCHELDSTLIGIYGFCRENNIPYFEMFNEDNIGRFIEYYLEVPSLTDG